MRRVPSAIHPRCTSAMSIAHLAKRLPRHDANAHLRVLMHRDVRLLVVLVPGLAHLVLLGQVDPQLEAPQVALGDLGHL